MTQVAKEKEPVLGLIIQLQKYGLNSHGYMNNSIIFGFYDSLEIEPVTEWLKYSPFNDNASCAWKSDSLRISHYPIKLVFPSPEMIDASLSELSYEEWKDPLSLQREFPCMTIVLVSLTDLFIDYADKAAVDPVKLFSQKVGEACKKSGLDLKQAHCCILPSLGYSDCCILLADTNWSFALKLVEQLHDIKTDGDIPILSTDYIIPVYHRVDDAVKSEHFSGIQMSVRVNLMPGYSVQTLANEVPDEIKTYRVSGGSDCLLTTDTPQAAKKLLDYLLPKDDNNLVIDMASMLRIGISPKEAFPLPPPYSNPNAYAPIKGAIGELKDAIDRYEDFLKNHFRHIRQANALRELTATIENICNQLHTGELREIMTRLTNAFASCLNRCSEETSDRDITEQELRIEQFRVRVSSFLGDLSRSDCFFMEQEQYNHSSVSSATSLLLAYNRWLNEFSKVIQNIMLPESRSEYAFLVTSGGCDQTKTHNPFYFLTPIVQNDCFFEKLPLLIQMSEMSLFDFSGTILRVTHECMHFCGERFRERRQDDIIKFLSQFYAEAIESQLFPAGRYYDYVVGILWDTYDVKDPAVINKVRQCFQSLTAHFIKSVRKELHKELMAEAADEEIGAKNALDYLALYTKLRLTQGLANIFSGYELSAGPNPKFQFNQFADFLYKETQRTIADYFGQCDEILRDCGIDAMFCAFDQRKQSLFMQAKDRRKDRATAELIQQVLSQLLMSEETVPLNNDGMDKVSPRQPFADFRKRNIITILDNVFDIFSESFSDVAACAVLNVSFEDYILMHTFENWDLEEAFQEILSNVYRIPAILTVCFPDQLELSPEGYACKLNDKAKRGLAAAVARLEAHGMPKDQLNADQLCEKTDNLLTKWLESAGKESLIAYLVQCYDKYKKIGSDPKLKPYRSAFQDSRLLQIDPAGSKTGSLQNDILGMLDSFIKMRPQA